MRAHRGEARARQAAYDFGLFRRAFAKPIDWGDVSRLSREQKILRGRRPWLVDCADRTARAVSLGRVKGGAL